MKFKSYIFPFIILFAFGAFWMWETWSIISQHWHCFYLWCQNTHRSYYPWLIWVTIGAVVFPVVNKRWENSEMIKTLLHERAHMLVNLITFQQVDSLFASSSQGGVVWSRHMPNSKVPRYLSSLAPYCFPYITVVLLLFRCLCTSSLLPVMDVLLGISVGLHLTCFKEQTGNHQTDISSFPLWFSYTYIVHFWFFHAALILLSLKPGSNIFYAFRDFGVDLWKVLVHLF